MLKAVKNYNGQKPKNGFRGWTYPVEGFEFIFNDSYESLTDLHRHVVKFETANKLAPLDNLYAILEDHFCRTCSYYRQFCMDIPEITAQVKHKFGRIISGGKAVAKIKAKSAKGVLKVLPLEEVQKNVEGCDGCSLNKYADSVGHELMYAGNVAKAYGVKDLSELDVQLYGHHRLGQCTGCGCKVKTKVYLDVENYGSSLTDNPHDINKMLKAETGNGEVCWQLSSIFLPEHLEAIKKQSKITHKQLKEWGYLDA